MPDAPDDARPDANARHAAPSFSLQDLAALVIGGSSGIGFAIAEGFRSQGARVAVAGRTRAKIDAAAERLSHGGAFVRGYTADVTIDRELDALVDAVLAEFGRIDILVPAQGITTLKPAEEFATADYDSIMNTNMRSVFFACTRVGRHMLERKHGSIINIGSMAAHRGWPRAAVYAVSKHGVVGLTKTLAAEWADRGVRVNAISPGFFATELTKAAMTPLRRDSAIRRTPMGRFGALDELVGTAVFLASPASAFVTGAVINVDGGYLASGI
jgi:NAD(P)-dependent dehydrogenase (short-subunit alcohol dehydrogenase family)